MKTLTERQKKMLFCIEGLRNLEKRTDSKNQYAQNLFELFCKEFDQQEFYEWNKNR